MQSLPCNLKLLYTYIYEALPAETCATTKISTVAGYHVVLAALLFHFRIVVYILRTPLRCIGLEISTDADQTDASYNSTESFQESYSDENRAWTSPATTDESSINQLSVTTSQPTRPTFISLGHISKEAHSDFVNTIWHFLAPTLSLIGIFGNICGVWFMLHEKMVRQPFHLYLLALMITDLFLLFPL